MKKNPVNTIIIIAAVIVTVSALFFAWVLMLRPFKVTKAENMKQVDYSEVYKQKPTEYYVFIYDEESVLEDDLETIAIEYANYARLHSDALPIFAYNLRAEGASKIESDLSLSSTNKLPGLIKVKNGSITTQYLTVSKMSNELEQAMNK